MREEERRTDRNRAGRANRDMPADLSQIEQVNKIQIQIFIHSLLYCSIFCLQKRFNVGLQIFILRSSNFLQPSRSLHSVLFQVERQKSPCFHCIIYFSGTIMSVTYRP